MYFSLQPGGIITTDLEAMDDEEETYCCINDFFKCKEFYKNHTLKENPLECASFVSFWCIVCGMSLVILGFAIPRDYTFDTTIPAREMESIEQYYSNLSFTLDICSIIGMGFVTLGGLLMANATLYVMWKSIQCEEHRPMPSCPGREDMPLQAYTPKSYGSGTHQSTDSMIEPSAPSAD